MGDDLWYGVWNDQNGDRPQPIRAQTKTVYHYVIVRADLPWGVQAAQIIHAAGESCTGSIPAGTHAVALHVRDEEQLYRMKSSLWDEEVPHVMIRENEGPFAGQAMAIGVFPTVDRDPIRRVTSSLPLVR